MLIDWRAPAAEAFYRATAKNNMGVSKRRHISLINEKIAQIYDDDLKNYLSELCGQNEALKEATFKKRTGRMGEIVATIQKEQDEIIRHKNNGIFVVNGAPGTGKTVVALHRVAYMLYSFRERLSKNGILILGPSKVFSNYISRVLPSLGEDNVYITTVSNLHDFIKPSYDDSNHISKIKGQLKMHKVLENAVLQRIRIIPSDKKIDSITIRQIDIFKVQKELKKQNKKYNAKRVLFLNKMIDLLAKEFAVNNNLAPDIFHIKDEQLEYSKDIIRSNEKIVRTLNLCWMPLTEKKVLNDLLTKRDYLEKCAHNILTIDEIDTIFNPNKDLDKFSTADIALLDELNEILGGVEEVSKTKNKKNENIEYIKQMLSSYGENNIYSAHDLYARYEGDYSMSVENDNKRSKFEHIIIDEAQDISPMEWRAISRRSINKSMTIVGDLAQAHFDYGVKDWKSYLSDLIGNQIIVKNLNVNYRTPKSIMEYAQEYGKKNNLNITKVDSVKELENSIQFFDCNSFNNVIQKILDNISTDGKNAVIIDDNIASEKIKFELLKKGIDTTTISDKRDTLLSNVSILTAKESKGLEFDNVFVFKQKQYNKSDLYVAFTRATNKLVVLNEIFQY